MVRVLRCCPLAHTFTFDGLIDNRVSAVQMLRCVRWWYVATFSCPEVIYQSVQDYETVSVEHF